MPGPNKDYVVHNTIVSLGDNMQPKKLKLKKKKTKKNKSLEK